MELLFQPYPSKTTTITAHLQRSHLIILLARRMVHQSHPLVMDPQVSPHMTHLNPVMNLLSQAMALLSLVMAILRPNLLITLLLHQVMMLLSRLTTLPVNLHTMRLSPLTIVQNHHMIHPSPVMVPQWLQYTPHQAIVDLNAIR